MYTKAKLYNLALGALLLTRKIADVDTDTSKECQVLNVHWDAAFRTSLEDLDLDSLSTQRTLELIEEEPNTLWLFAYKYPSNCSFFRRIQTAVIKDTRSTRIPLRVVNHEGTKAIYTNEAEAIGEYISNDFPLSLLSASAGLAIAYKLAHLSAPLVAGKGAKSLRDDIMKNYLVAKAEAQEHDRMENANFDGDDVMSEFVEARIE